MPKVSDAHREARRRQIIDAAWICFSRNGFQATSMQDVFAEAGLSAGAVYGYFRSKNELVAAVADEALVHVGKALREHLDVDPPPPPAAAVELVTRTMVEFAQGPGYDRTRVALSTWAASLRDPEVATVVHRVYGGIRGTLEDVARRWIDHGDVPPDSDPVAVSRAFFGWGLGFLVQRVLLGDVDAATYSAGAAALLAGGRSCERPS
jgi:AcrR family transcriptional regulator